MKHMMSLFIVYFLLLKSIRWEENILVLWKSVCWWSSKFYSYFHHIIHLFIYFILFYLFIYIYFIYFIYVRYNLKTSFTCNLSLFYFLSFGFISGSKPIRFSESYYSRCRAWWYSYFNALWTHPRSLLWFI